MEDDKDSLRFYYLGNKYQTKVEHFGAKKSYEPEGVLMVWLCEHEANMEFPVGSHLKIDNIDKLSSGFGVFL